MTEYAKPVYRVENIEETTKPDGSACWMVSFAGKKCTFADSDTPTYKIGDELPFALELVKPAQGNWYYKRKETAQASTDKPKTGYAYRAPTGGYQRNDDAIMLQVAFKGAVECDEFWYVPDGTEHARRVLETTLKLYKGLKEMRDKPNSLVEEAKNKYGAEEN